MSIKDKKNSKVVAPPSKQEVILSGNRLEYTMLACNPSKCIAVRTSQDGNKYLILPLFDHQRGLHLLNIGEPELAQCFITKYSK